MGEGTVVRFGSSAAGAAPSGAGSPGRVSGAAGTGAATAAAGAGAEFDGPRDTRRRVAPIRISTSW